MFAGHDSRFAMEQNLGPTQVGVQKSGWLYQQTKTLVEDYKVKLTLSGDQPFVMRLVNGDNVEDDSKCAIYVGKKSSIGFDVKDGKKVFQPFLSTTVDPKTKKRTTLNIPWQVLPSTSLVYLDDIRRVCVDTCHGITRMVENDLQKFCNLLIETRGKTIYTVLNLFESNLTERGVKEPRFRFNINTSKNGPTSCNSVSLSGKEALLAIAHRDEFGSDSGIQSNLFDNVFKENEYLVGHPANLETLKLCHKTLFKHEVLLEDKTKRYLMSKYDAAELWRQSLNNMNIILRGSKNGFPQKLIDEYNFWAETYYHISMAFFGEVTPYKVKILLVPKLVESGCIRSPWDHLTEAMEHSNHRAHQFYHQKTMRGGGKLLHVDPMLQDLVLSFFRCYIHSKQQIAFEECMMQLRSIFRPIPTFHIDYLWICRKTIKARTIQIDTPCEKDSIFLGLRFTVFGDFRKANLTQVQVNKMILECGGLVLTQDALKTLTEKHSHLPFCYVLVQNETDLRIATGEPGVGRPMEKREKIVEKKERALKLRCYVQSGVVFLNVKFVVDCLNKPTLLDPANYEIKPGNDIPIVPIRDMKPLFKRQCEAKEIIEGVTKGPFVLIKEFRKQNYSNLTQDIEKIFGKRHTKKDETSSF